MGDNNAVTSITPLLECRKRMIIYVKKELLESTATGNRPVFNLRSIHLGSTHPIQGLQSASSQTLDIRCNNEVYIAKLLSPTKLCYPLQSFQRLVPHCCTCDRVTSWAKIRDAAAPSLLGSTCTRRPEGNSSLLTYIAPDWSKVYLERNHENLLGEADQKM